MKIICFTGSRAEYYLLRPLLIALKKVEKYEVFLIISGGILTEETKKTIEDIKKDKINICGEIRIKNLNSKDIASNLVKDIFGEDLNNSSVEASVLQTIKEYQKDK